VDVTLTETRRLLAEIGLRPRQALGQNFLVDANILAIILREAEVRTDEVVLEIGPGLGALTGPLAERARQVVAIEKDRRLAAYLRERFPQVELIEGDAVAILGSQPAVQRSKFEVQRSRFDSLPPSFKVVANLPYNISTPMLERLVEAERRPRRMVVTLQREVGQRLQAQPRHKEYGALTLFTRLHYHVTIAHLVSRACFYPAPKVQSTIVVLDRRTPRERLRPGAPFHALVRQGFSQRRKMLRNLLPTGGAAAAAWCASEITPTVRAEELSLEQWIRLANAWPVGEMPECLSA